jgi:hypothetical protein
MWKRVSLLVSLVSGCGVGGVSEQSFRQALPSRQALEVSVPAGGGSAGLRAGSAALVGERAGLYVLTRETIARVNGQVGSVLDTLGSIAQNHPTAVGPDSARWGPFTDALSPVAWQLVVQQLGPANYAFQLQLRPKAAADAAFQPFLQGLSEGVGPAAESQGTFSVDLALAHQLDPVGNPLDGQMVAGWRAQTDSREVHLHLAGVHAPADPPASADVGAVLLPDGSGAVVLEANANLIGTADALEVGRVGSRWNATGAGRADAEIHEVDGGAGAAVTECWDTSFDRVYFRAETADGGSTEGEASACVFAEPLR